jgi:hypothetical protein
VPMPEHLDRFQPLLRANVEDREDGEEHAPMSAERELRTRDERALLEARRELLLDRSARRREAIRTLERAESLRAAERALLERYLEQEAKEALELERLEREIEFHMTPGSDPSALPAASQGPLPAPMAASANLTDLSQQMLRYVKKKKGRKTEG